MQLSGVTYSGPKERDAALLALLPQDLRKLLEILNGFVSQEGGLHVRGACDDPAWHSLRLAWFGPRAVFRLYRAVGKDDIPFGQDCVANQLLLRDGVVHRLDAGTGIVDNLFLSLDKFLQATEASPLKVLALQPLRRFQKSAGKLAPGQVLEPASRAKSTWTLDANVQVRAVPADEALARAAEHARGMS